MKQAQTANARGIGKHLVTIMFACIGVVEIIAGEYLDAGLWIALAMGFAFLGTETRPWREIGFSRRIAGAMFFIAAVALFAIRIATDLSS